jgi:hypothetical protein
MRMPEARRWIPWALLPWCALAGQDSGTNPFPKIGEVRLNERLAALGEAKLDYFSVSAISFSPDGRRLGIAFRDASELYLLQVQPHRQRGYLLVQETANFDTTVYWTSPAKAGIPDASFSLAWAPDGNSLVWGGLLIHLPGGDSCRLSSEFGFGGFLNSATALIRSAKAGAASLTTFGIMDSQCRLREEWTADGYFDWGGISPDGHLMALVSHRINRSGAIGGNGVLLLVPAMEPHAPPLAGPGNGVPRVRLNLTGARKTNTEQLSRGLVFVDDAICGMLRAPPQRAEIQCRSTHTDKLVRHSGLAWSGRAMVVSAGGERIAVSDPGSPGSGPAPPITSDGGRSVGNRVGPNRVEPIPPTRAIWDFRNGKMLAKWSPDPAGPVGLPGMRLDFAISPDGHLIAEASSDSVAVYRLP